MIMVIIGIIRRVITTIVLETIMMFTMIISIITTVLLIILARPQNLRITNSTAARLLLKLFGGLQFQILLTYVPVISRPTWSGRVLAIESLVYLRLCSCECLLRMFHSDC